jgi:hypothetical protein
MKKKRLSLEQIIGVLKQAEVGVPVAEVIRKVGDQRADVLTCGRRSTLVWKWTRSVRWRNCRRRICA